MSKKTLFVGGLSQTTNEKHLISYFGNFGAVSGAKVARYRISGKPRGYGFVYFEKEDSLEKIFRQDEHWVDERKVDCQPAQDSTNKNKHKEEMKERRLFVSDLPQNTTDKILEEHFVKFGALRSAYVTKDQKSGLCIGYGFILFHNNQDAARAAFITEQKINGVFATVLPYKFRRDYELEKKRRLLNDLNSQIRPGYEEKLFSSQRDDFGNLGPERPEKEEFVRNRFLKEVNWKNWMQPDSNERIESSHQEKNYELLNLANYRFNLKRRRYDRKETREIVEIYRGVYEYR